MKKQFLLIVPLLLLCTLTLAQIPNASFENWTGGDPNNWFTSNNPPFLIFITESNNAHAGSSAAECHPVEFQGFVVSPLFALGTNGEGANTAIAPEAVHGWYIANLDSGDQAITAIGMMDNNGITGAGVAYFTTTSVYKEFVANMYYYTGSPNGDSISIFFLMTPDSSSETLHIGSYYIVDDLSFGAPTGTDDVNNSALPGLKTISPNPGSDEAQIIYSIRRSGKTDLSIYDLNGRMIKSVVNEQQTPGRYKAFANLSDLPAGTYVCRLMSDGTTDFRKVMVQR